MARHELIGRPPFDSSAVVTRESLGRDADHFERAEHGMTMRLCMLSEHVHFLSRA
jgi:hypothetical protein